jgi:hypothetical protein
MAGYSSPLLDPYNRTGVVTAPLQRALAAARSKLAPTLPGGDAASASPGLVPSPAAPATGIPGAAAAPAVPAATTPRAPLAGPSTLDADNGEVARLTKPPLPSTDPGAHTSADTGQSGVGQIHNPWLRTPLKILDAIGSTFLPALTMNLPGTELHHQMLVHAAMRNQKGAQGEETNEADTTLKRAQARKALTDVNDTKAQVPHTLTTAKGIMQWNPDSSRFDIPAGEAPPKEEVEGKTVTTDQGIMQWDPKTSSYSIKVGNAPEKETGDKTLQDADGVWYHLGKDNAAVPITVNGQPFQGKTPEVKSSPEQQFIDEYRGKNKGASIADAERAFKAIQPPEKANEGTWSLQQTSGGKTVLFNTKTGATKDAPADIVKEGDTSAMRTREAQGGIIKQAGDQLIASIEKHRDKIGNVGSYWNQFKNGSPIADKDTAGLMAQIASFAALQPSLHGFRGQQALAEFEKVIGGVPKNADALEAAIKAIQGTAGVVQGGGRAAAPAGANVIEYVRDKNGKLVPKP